MADTTDDGMKVLREVETKWLAGELGLSIANLAYPVGCGVAPQQEHLEKAAGKLFDRYSRMIEMARRAPHDAALDTIEFDLRETLRAVLHFWGPEGANKVTTHVMLARKSRDTNAEIDALESALATN